MYSSGNHITKPRKSNEQVVLVARIMGVWDKQRDVWEIELMGAEDRDKVVKRSSMTKGLYGMGWQGDNAIHTHTQIYR